jgi:transcription antitermination factor NusG
VEQGMSTPLRYWHPVYTKPRNEKKVADRLVAQGYEVYCPLREDRVRWSDRWKTIQKPVFTSYVFVHVTEAERLEVLNDSGIVRSVFYLKKPGVIQDAEIKAIRLFLEEFYDTMLEPFEPGTRVHVKEGPLSGEVATLVSQSGGYARLRIESLGMNLVAKVHTSKLEGYHG